MKQVQNDTPRNEKFVILLNVIYRKSEKCLYAKIFDIYIFFLLLFWKSCDLFDDFTNEKAIIEEIQKDFSGIIISKYSTRDTPPIFLKIKNKNTFFDISFSREIMTISSIGDSIVYINYLTIIMFI